MTSDIEKQHISNLLAKRYRIAVDSPTSLPPDFSILMPGQVKLVPKHAIRFVETDQSKTEKGTE